MEPSRRSALPAAIDDLRSRLSRWRSAQTKRSAIPQELWREAGRLAGVYGVSRVATALGLGYYGVKKRVEAAKERPSGAGFVEIDHRASLFPPSFAVEVEKSDGAKMVIRVSGSAPVDLAGLVDSFLGQR